MGCLCSAIVYVEMMHKKKSPKSIVGALAITAMTFCVIYMAGQEAAPEDVKYMPSVPDVVPGFSLGSSEDSSDDDDSDDSSSSKSDGDDDFMSDIMGESSSDDSSSSSSSDDDEDSSDNSLSEGDNVRVQYKLRLPNGKEVYRQWGDGGGVIPGFDSAISDMSVGESKRVTIDSDDAYGS